MSMDKLIEQYKSLEQTVNENKVASDTKMLQMKSTMDTLATKDDVARVADSIEQMVELFKGFKSGVQISGRVARWSVKAVLYVGALAAAITAIAFALKTLGFSTFLWMVTPSNNS